MRTKQEILEMLSELRKEQIDMATNDPLNTTLLFGYQWKINGLEWVLKGG